MGGAYCPQKYCEIIKTFVDLKASIILRAVSNWEIKAGSMQEGEPFHSIMRQLVIDINKAYDCAGLRRPVIQAGFFEWINENVNNVTIPVSVISEFKDEMTILERNYYFNGLTPKSTIKFNKSRIAHYDNTAAHNSPDILNIEGRMWLFHCAKLWIDLGYKSIHLGQMGIWARDDINFQRTSSIIRKIRSYASSKNTFVLLSEENFHNIKFTNTDTFMFDFDSKVLWPAEVNGNQIFSRCNNISSPNYLPGTICNSELYKAIIDNCNITGEGNTSGYSPTNGCYIPYMPFNTYFDLINGIHPPVNVATNSPNQSVWGYDDTRWFATKISNACREFWLGDAISRLRNYYNGFGFMSVPVLLTVKYPELYNNKDLGLMPNADGKYLLSDEINVKNTVKEKWKPNDNIDIIIDENCIQTSGSCPIFLGSITQKKIKKYTLSLDSPDYSTIYTWHIQNPNNTWQTFSHGSTRTIDPSITGNGYYKIHVRQDNLGGFNTNTGTKSTVFTLYFESDCCNFATPFSSSEELAILNNQLKYSKKESDDEEYFKYINSYPQFVKENTSKEIEFEKLDSEIKNFNIYPNPDFEYINIESMNNTISHFIISIYNSVGQLLLRKENDESNKEILNISFINTGVYQIKITDKENNTLYIDKFIKM